MPRLSAHLIRQAHAISPYLALLLRPCRTLRSAQNELRWLKEHAVKKAEVSRTKFIYSEYTKRPPHGTAWKQRQFNASGFSGKTTLAGWRALLANYVSRRARGEPLQYIIGTQPFGTLDILCEPGVLIPRPETERIVHEVAKLIAGSLSTRDKHKDVRQDVAVKEHKESPEYEHARSELRILDLCTGTGCIPLLLYDILRRSRHFQNKALKLYGADISTHALSLARKNRYNTVPNPPTDHPIQFFRADVLDTTFHQPPFPNASRDETAFDAFSTAPPILSALHRISSTPSTVPPKIDVLISNPPYISPSAYDNGTTSRSVRRYEPKLALVPPPPSVGMNVNVARGDEFYAKILEVAKYVEAKLVVFEVGDPAQADRVRKMMSDGGWEGDMEVWEIGGEEGVRAVIGAKGIFATSNRS